MSINDYRPQEIIEQRKRVSDLKNDTDDLTFFNSNKPSSHGEAARAVRDKKEVLKIKALEHDTDEKELERMLNDISPD